MKNKIFGFILLVLVAIFCISNSAYASDWKEGKDVSLIHEEEQKGGQPSTKQKTEKEEIPISKEAEEIVRAISDWAKNAKPGITTKIFPKGIVVTIQKTTSESTWSKNQVRYYKWQYTKFEPLPEALQKGLSIAGRMQQPPGGSLRPVGYTWTTTGRTTSVRLLDYCKYYFVSVPYGDRTTYKTKQTQATILGNIATWDEIGEEVRKKINEIGGKWTESQTVETGREKDVPVGPAQTHVAEGPGDVTVGEDVLQTTSRVIFSREYVYTEDIIDAITDKGFELEVVYDFTANTTIKEIFIPVHTITRYKNMGTMTITPVDWSWRFYNGNTSVRIWAKFRYPKAAVPGRSPMLFRVRVNTRDGTCVVSDQIDVPVNTLNGRFTDVPESETGELYPIKGLYKVNNREYLKNFGTINHAGIYIP
jgi:hypothetical protein